MNEITRQSKLIIEVNIIYPLDITADYVAGVMTDYMHVNRFVVGRAEVTIYPTDVKVVQNAIKLVGGKVQTN